MRKTGLVTLALIGAGGLLASCGQDDPEVQSGMFESVAVCTASGSYSAAECKTAFDTAKASNSTEAPKFTAKAQCEEQFGTGNCETSTASDGSSVFMPLMAGFMIGQALNGSGGHHYYHQPVYKDKKKGYVNGGGYFVSHSYGAVRTRSSSYTTSKSYSGSSSYSKSTSTAARGGFGSRGGASVSS